MDKNRYRDQQEDVDEENQSYYVLSDSLATPMSIFVSLCEFRFRVQLKQKWYYASDFFIQKIPVSLKLEQNTVIAGHRQYAYPHIQNKL